MNDDIKKPQHDNLPVEPPESVDLPAPEPQAAANNGLKEALAQEPVNQPIAPEQPQSKNGESKHEEEHHLIPIILTIIVLIFLVAVAIIADKNKSNKQDGLGSSADSPSQQAPAQAAETNDQQTINDSINDINNLSNDDDMSGQSLSDQNLGL